MISEFKASHLMSCESMLSDSTDSIYTLLMERIRGGKLQYQQMLSQRPRRCLQGASRDFIPIQQPPVEGNALRALQLGGSYVDPGSCHLPSL